MAIDILFIIMAAFGFYFGFTFGLTKVVLVVASLSIAILTAMGCTPMATNLIVDTFEIDSVFLPFVAFLITLLVVLMLARIVTKLIEETIDNKRFDTISQGIGGVVMGLVFTLLYSVLVVFFGQARVIDLVFNHDIMMTKIDQGIRLGINKANLNPEITTLILMQKIGDSTNYTFDGNSNLSFGVEQKTEDTYQAYIGGQNGKHLIKENDTFLFSSEKKQLHVIVEQRVVCFCDNPIMVTAQNDSIFFDCTDKEHSSESETSFFYKYIEVIPKRGTTLMQGVSPFVQEFLDYMGIALERLNKGHRNTPKPIEVYSEDENKTTKHPEVDEPIEEEEILDFSIDTTDMPTVNPKEDEKTKEEEVKYEG